MFSNTFRSYISVTKQLCSNVFTYSIKCKYVKSSVTLSVHSDCAQNPVLLARCYSTVSNRSTEVTLEYKRKYEEKLNELLKDPKFQELYDKLKLEVESIRHTTHRVPETLDAYDWLMLFSSKTHAQKRGYLSYLWKNEKRLENEEQKKESKKSEKEVYEKMSVFDPENITYGLHRNTMFLRIYDTTISHFYNSRLMNAMMYEPTIVFDLGYDNYMTAYEAQNCARQLVLSFSENRLHDNPFNLYFCNANKSSFVMQRVHYSIPTLYDIDFPLNITSKSYLEIFDKSKLVYLTPHTTNVLHKFDPNMIYIVGAMVDKISPQPISLAKAKKEGLKVAALPLNQHLEWGAGSGKSLTINQVMKILLDVRHSQNWTAAFKNVPTRKLRQSRDKVQSKNIEKRQQIIKSLMQQQTVDH